MRPQNDQLVQIISEGRDEARRVSIANKLDEYTEPREFANRMIMRLYWAEQRIRELEDQVADS